MVARLDRMRVGGGTLRIFAVDEARCGLACARAHPSSCHAVDYDTVRRECHMHTTYQTACQPLIPNVNFNHHRRYGCASKFSNLKF